MCFNRGLWRCWLAGLWVPRRGHPPHCHRSPDWVLQDVGWDKCCGSRMVPSSSCLRGGRAGGSPTIPLGPEYGWGGGGAYLRDPAVLDLHDALVRPAPVGVRVRAEDGKGSRPDCFYHIRPWVLSGGAAGVLRMGWAGRKRGVQGGGGEGNRLECSPSLSSPHTPFAWRSRTEQASSRQPQAVRGTAKVETLLQATRKGPNRQGPSQYWNAKNTKLAAWPLPIERLCGNVCPAHMRLLNGLNSG